MVAQAAVTSVMAEQVEPQDLVEMADLAESEDLEEIQITEETPEITQTA
jgi:hypothetical protein